MIWFNNCNEFHFVHDGYVFRLPNKDINLENFLLGLHWFWFAYIIMLQKCIGRFDDQTSLFIILMHHRIQHNVKVIEIKTALFVFSAIFNWSYFVRISDVIKMFGIYMIISSSLYYMLFCISIWERHWITAKSFLSSYK